MVFRPSLQLIHPYLFRTTPEYWIVDYLALGSRDYLGNPKTPAVFIFLLDENGTYQMSVYRDGDRLISPTFPELNLIAEQILDL